MRDDEAQETVMRTTVSIDDDVLTAVRAIARQKQSSVGEVLSRLARSALHRPAPAAVRNGVPLLPLKEGGALVTLDIVNALRDETS
jgi:hypothetical protein